MARYADYANLFDKVSRMVNSKLWATPLWYQGARLVPPPVNLKWPPPPAIEFPEERLYEKIMTKIPILRLEKENGGINPYTEKSIAWKFAKRQYRYMNLLKLSEAEAFKLTEEDMNPEIHEFMKILETTPPEAEKPPFYEELRGSGLEEEHAAQPKMVPSNKLSVYGIQSNIKAARTAATIARARKRKEGVQPTEPMVTDNIEKEFSVRPNQPPAVDPLYGPPDLFSRRKKMFLRQIEDFGIESVQRRFMEKPSTVHEQLKVSLSAGVNKSINNPTAEFLADKILPDAQEVATLREQTDEPSKLELHEARLDAFRAEADAAGLHELRLTRGAPLSDIVMQAEKLKGFRAVMAKTIPSAEAVTETADGTTKYSLNEAERVEVQSFVDEWVNQDTLQERREKMQAMLADLGTEDAEKQWQANKSKEAMVALKKDLYGVDTEKGSTLDSVPAKYRDMMQELSFLAKRPERESMHERIVRRKEAEVKHKVRESKK